MGVLTGRYCQPNMCFVKENYEFNVEDEPSNMFAQHIERGESVPWRQMMLTNGSNLTYRSSNVTYRSNNFGLVSHCG